MREYKGFKVLTHPDCLHDRIIAPNGEYLDCEGENPEDIIDYIYNVKFFHKDIHQLILQQKDIIENSLSEIKRLQEKISQKNKSMAKHERRIKHLGLIVEGKI